MRDFLIVNVHNHGFGRPKWEKINLSWYALHQACTLNIQLELYSTDVKGWSQPDMLKGLILPSNIIEMDIF